MTGSDSHFPETQASLLLQLKGDYDSEAWHHFVTLYRPVIYRLARRRGLQDADAQDLSQQVLLSIAGSIDRWEKRDESIRFRHWLRRVAKNAICNALTRRPKDVAAGGTSTFHAMEEQQSENEDLAQEIELERRRELFLRAAAIVKSDVAADTWTIFEQTVIDGTPIEDVAAGMKKSVGAAYAARGRVMTRLRHQIEDMEQHAS